MIVKLFWTPHEGIISKHKKQHMEKQHTQNNKTYIVQTTLDTTWRDHINKQKTHGGKQSNQKTTTKMFKLVWLRGPLSQTSLTISLFVCLCCCCCCCFSQRFVIVVFLRCAALRRCAPLLRSADLICAALRCTALRFALWANRTFSK